MIGYNVVIPMNSSQVIGSLMTLLVAASPAPQVIPQAQVESPVQHILAQHTYSLSNRYTNTFVNDVFAENILLTLSYMEGLPHNQKIDWEKVRQDSTYSFVLKPGETFAFHDQVLNQYKDNVVKTTNSDFSSDQGFRSDGWLVGDGVCHFASFIHVVASEAGLAVDAPTNHNFAKIEDVDKKFGTSIYYLKDGPSVSEKQNLYVTNTLDKPLEFIFDHQADSLKIVIAEAE